MGGWVHVSRDKQYWRVTESKVNDRNGGRRLYTIYTKGVTMTPEFMISKGFAYFRLFWKIYFSFLRILIKFSNLTSPYLFLIPWAAAATWDTPRHSACPLFLSSRPPSHLASVLSHHPAHWEGSASSPYVRGIKRYRSQRESLTHSAHVLVRRHQGHIDSAASEQQHPLTQWNLS